MSRYLQQLQIVSHEFPLKEYFQKKYPKLQVVLHHTVSPDSAHGDITWWEQQPGRIATAIIIDRSGVFHRVFSTAHWGHHIGAKAINNVALNQHSVGVELDGWGPAEKHNGKFYPVGRAGDSRYEIPEENVQHYPDKFRGHEYYEKYTEKQIEALRLTLLYLNEQYGIPLDYKEGMWALNSKALTGEAGIWTHASYRSDKSDCHPQPELIEMLKCLSHG